MKSGVPPANFVSMSSTLTVIDGASEVSRGEAAGAGAGAAGQVIVIDMLLRRTLAVPWSWVC
jgi:hypothetical protein